MTFTCSTKPLNDALAMSVIQKNVNKFYPKSCLARLKASSNRLTINLEAANIVTEISIFGSGDEESCDEIYVDCIRLKNLVGAVSNDVVSLEFIEHGVVLHVGNSKYTLEQMMDSNDVLFNVPSTEYKALNDEFVVEGNPWKFVQDHLMYIRNKDTKLPLYQYVWTNEDGKVIVGDMENGMFATTTLKGGTQFSKALLLSDTIVNLMNSIPSGTKICETENGYRIAFSNDAFEYVAEFVPRYEGEPGVGDFQAPTILGLLDKNADDSVEIDISGIVEFLNKTSILTALSDTIIEFSVENGILDVKNRLSHYSMQVKGDNAEELNFSLKFIAQNLYEAISHTVKNVVHIQPSFRDDIPVGIVFWEDNLSTIVAGAD